MAENTKIEWADHTFNPWTGCTKVGPGCDHCYAEGWAKRSGQVQWGPGAERRRTSEANWRKPLRWNAEAERLGIRYRVFCASLADVFDNEVPAEWRADLFHLIEQTPNLDWLLVTKRIGNVERMVMDALRTMFFRTNQEPLTWPWVNVWLGITVVNQTEADRDIPKLLSMPAAVRFLSLEPLLGAVDLWGYLPNPFSGCPRASTRSGPFCDEPAVDWVIVGGESDPKARPMHPQWARDIRDQCEFAGVPFLFKQWGEWSPGNVHEAAGATQRVRIEPSGDVRPWPPAFDVDCGSWCMHKVGKKKAGRLLDGREHNGFPMQPPKNEDSVMKLAAQSTEAGGSK